MKKLTKIAVVYHREVSKSQQALEDQIEFLKNKAKELGYCITKTFKDHCSGNNAPLTRSGFGQLIEFLDHHNEVTEVLVFDATRISRHDEHITQVTEMLEARNVRVNVVDNSYAL